MKALLVNLLSGVELNASIVELLPLSSSTEVFGVEDLGDTGLCFSLLTLHAVQLQVGFRENLLGTSSLSLNEI